MHPALALGIAYLAGSIPSAYLAGRALKGVDLRTIGSGNLGATNVYRNLGPTAAVVVLLIDALKGALPVAILPTLLDSAAMVAPDAGVWWGLTFGIAAIAGHSKSIFLLWMGGGKGVATAAGVLAAIAPVALAACFIVFGITLWRSQIVSLASVTAALTLPGALAVTVGIGSPVFVVGLAIAGFVIFSHRANLQRLRDGTEPRITRSPPEGAP